VIDCQASGEPTSTVGWKRDYINITAEDTDDRISQLPNNSLQIVAAQLLDSGLYFCIANNSIGSVLKKVNILVKGGCRWCVVVERKYSTLIICFCF